MDAFGSHTFRGVTGKHEAFLVKYRLEIDQSITYLTAQDATRSLAPTPIPASAT
jgi:catalase